jgi:hypothetical protein
MNQKNMKETAKTINRSRYLVYWGYKESSVLVNVILFTNSRVNGCNGRDNKKNPKNMPVIAINGSATI